MLYLQGRSDMAKTKLFPGILLFCLYIGSHAVLEDKEDILIDESQQMLQVENLIPDKQLQPAILNQMSIDGASRVQSKRETEKLSGGDEEFVEEAGSLEDSMEGKETKSSLSSYGAVSSPFYFMCHYPRPGEPTGIGKEDVTISVEFAEMDANPPFYEPHAVYQVLVTSNVLLDGFMLTGIHAFTKKLSEGSHINMPTSLHGGATNGLLCTVLHSHISHKPRRNLSFLWMAPPSGSGCVNFLAQGSLGEQLLFKDLPILEVCEKESSAAKLRIKESLLTGTDLPGFIFRDDFESERLETSIWNEILGGSVGNHNQRMFSGSAATFEESYSEITSRPMDFSRVKHLHFTLGNDCSSTDEVELSFGFSRKVEAGVEIYEGSGDPSSFSSHEGSEISGNELETEFLTSVSEGQNDPKADGSRCMFWEKVHSYRLGHSNEVHMRTVPPRFHQPGVCMKWSVGDSTGSNKTCWGLDNVAVTTVDVTSEPIYDDFDPVDPSNWFFIHGNEVQEYCGSEGNSMVFLGGKITTRRMDLKVLPSDDDIILEQYFLHEIPHG
ncbi:reelin-like [Palaemon carinicauda]|uniref:reelin-like n=1 Tax=Palaemon carinicauda TaxID=392227 RepID=UPI0035B63A0D